MLTIDPDSQTLPAIVQDLILSKRCVAFIGSGLSKTSYGTWLHVVNKLSLDCTGVSVNPDSTEDDLLDAAQAVKEADATRYFEWLGNHFGQPVDRANILYDILLALPFRDYLTINFDPLLAMKAPLSRRKCLETIFAYPALDRMNMTRRSLQHLHGMISEGRTPIDGNLVFSRDEFSAAYSSTSSLVNFLLPTLENDALLFLGCRLRDPPMAAMFKLCQEHQRKRQELIGLDPTEESTPPPRFLFHPMPQIKSSLPNAEESRDVEMEETDEYYSMLGIKTVWYEATDDAHSVLRKALGRLLDLPDPKPTYGWGENPYDC